ncbi:hypothetical protein GCM10023152_18130 [Agromyces bauzanensis]|uniref:Uncharacterized protein n=2 Tax=Agromyces bauzanensis TaxID=1308924 RepID=A0A917PGV0_9MICO|nr:hypothetical protein GCM10011372_13180 [Agromyces bauzanensis]
MAAVSSFLGRAPLIGVAPLEGEQIDPAAAESVVEYERLRCHMDAHWLHYAQAVWAREDPDQRLLRLQQYGPAASQIENELIGFHGDRGAFPLREPFTIEEIDLANLIEEIDADRKKLEDESKVQPILISMPTPGTLLEAVTGECDACETYIDESRAIDVRLQGARAAIEEVEADRRRQRVADHDLSDPSPPSNATLVVEVKQEGASPPGGGNP